MPKNAKIEAKAAVDKFMSNLSNKEIDELKDGFKAALLSMIKKQKDKLLETQSLIDEKTKESADLWEKQRLAKYPESSRLMDERSAVRKDIIRLESKALNHENAVQCIENGGMLSSITDKKGKEHNTIPDFRKVDTNEIMFDLETILSEKRPPYIPSIDESSFKYAGYVSDAIRIDKDSYILAINKYSEERETYYVIVTLDQLVLITDYYYSVAKANAIKDAEEINIRILERYEGMDEKRKESFLNQQNQAYVYKSLPANKKKEISLDEWIKLTWKEKDDIHKFITKKRPKKLKTVLDNDYMWASFGDMYRRFINPEAISLKKGYAHPEVGNYWATFSDMMNYKMKDIKKQRTEISDTYKAAIETSFGESNTSDVLKEKYGILVKRQNGSKINPVEVDQIEEAFVSIQKKFGNLKPNCLKYNIKISHTGTTYVFASKAIGVFIPSMGTIGVSDKFGDNQFRMTMAHEIGHFIDNVIGELNDKRWATDDYENTAGRIAFLFRDNMNKPASEQSDYTNATTECFARAMEQYYGIETLGDEAGIVFSDKPLDKEKPFYVADDFIDEDAYKNKLKPLIEEFLQENKDVLKYTVDITEVNEPVDVGNEEEMQYLAAIESLETLLEVSGGKEFKEINEAIESIKFLQGLGNEKMAEGGEVEKKEEIELPSNFIDLIKFLNEEKNPRIKAAQWNGDNDNEIAYRSHSLPDSGMQSLWQVAIKYGSAMEVGKSGTEDKVWFSGDDLFRAIKAMYKELGLKLKPIKQKKEIEPTPMEAAKAVEDIDYFKGIDFDYQNQFKLNKAIEVFLDTKTNDYIFSDQEKEFIYKYEGYGGLEKEGATGKELLWEYYTPELLNKKMWGLAYKYGFLTGKVLEPSVGTGRVLDFVSPQDEVTAYEISKYSARICQILHPKVDVRLESFEEHFYNGNVFNPKFEKGYDLVIGNPPYGKNVGRRSVAESKRLKVSSSQFEHYFILRGLDTLKSGGLLIFISTANLFTKGYEKVKESILEKAELVDAYMLPNATFKRTKINTSLIVLKRK